MAKLHDFVSSIVWTGNRGSGTRDYKGYDRTWDIALAGKDIIHYSNDPLLGGDPAKMNPEDLLISALSACHMLWYLHFASNAGIIVTGYRDDPVGHGETLPNGGQVSFRGSPAVNFGFGRNGFGNCRGNSPESA